MELTVEHIVSRSQISVIRKNLGAHPLLISMTNLFAELSLLVSFDGDGSVFGLWAQMVMDGFPHLRPDEIAHVFRSGANGKYGKIFGRISYNTIADWINEYDTNERENLFIKDQVKKQGEHKQSMKDWNVDFKPLIGIVDKQLTKDKETRTEAQPIVTQKDFDRRNYEAFMMFGKTYTDIQLQDALIGAQKNNFTETSNAIQEEINSRK